MSGTEKKGKSPSTKKEDYKSVCVYLSQGYFSFLKKSGFWCLKRDCLKGSRQVTVDSNL